MRKRTEEEIKEVVESLGYRYADNYTCNGDDRKVIIEDKLGYKYDAFLGNILRGQGIRFVDIRNRFSLENICLWLKINKSQFRLLENNEYKGKESKLNLYCNNCKDYPKINWHHILMNYGCGVCDGKQVGKYHNLSIQRPDIAKHWHPTLNGDLTPYDVTYGSNKKVWWVCSNGHEYCATIINRSNGRACPTCANEQKESKIATQLKEWCKETFGEDKVDPEHKMFKNSETGYWLKCDIYIGEKESIDGVYIEVHGGQHYKKNTWHNLLSKEKGTTPEEEFEYQKHKDRLKKRFARKYGIYIEIDLRKVKTLERAIEYVESILRKVE